MLKKNQRDVRFVKITFLRKAGDKFEVLYPEEDGKDPFMLCLSQLLNIINDTNQQGLLHRLRKGQICRGLRKISENRENIITLLWGFGDSEIVNPCFWDDKNDIIREESPKNGEKVAYSAHMLINIEYQPLLHGYIACLEEVPNLGTGAIEDSINKFIKEYVKIFVNDEGQKRKALNIKVEINTLASRNFEEVMAGRKPIEIYAETIDEINAFDERFNKTEKRVITLKARPNTPLEYFKQAFTELMRRTKGYRRYVIKYKEADNSIRSVSAENPRDNSTDNIDSYSFIQRDRIHLDTDIKQFCNEIHEELGEKMKFLLVAETKNLRNNSE